MQKRSCCAIGLPIRRWLIRDTARGIDLARLSQLNDMAGGGVRPDLTFLLDCPVEFGLARTAAARAMCKRCRRKRIASSGKKANFTKRFARDFSSWRAPNQNDFA